MTDGTGPHLHRRRVLVMAARSAEGRRQMRRGLEQNGESFGKGGLEKARSIRQWLFPLAGWPENRARENSGADIA